MVARIFDQRIDTLSLIEVFSLVKKSVKKKEKNLFFALNTHILIKLQENKVLKKLHEKSAKVIFPDGVPLVWFLKLRGYRTAKRVAGTDLTEMILQDKNFRVFLLGSSKKVLQKAHQKYASVFGFYAPPFNNDWLKKEKVKIRKKVRDSRANVILVAVGPLKQEQWLLENFYSLNCFVGLGVGSALDILVGDKPRAPFFLKNFGFEWLWRVFLEPKRLFYRYIQDFFGLFKLIIFR